MNRRQFLHAASALASWPLVIQTAPRPIISEFEDGYTIDVDLLRCSLGTCRSGSTLVFGVFITSYPRPGAIEETRMIPTELLKTRLEQIGFPVIWEQWLPAFPFLVAYLDHIPRPQDIAARLQWVLSSNDSRLFYVEPNRKPGRASIDPGEFLVR
jgi:hypothetical protein